MSSPPNIFLSLGSNIGNRIGNLKSAVKELNSRNIRVIACSAVYETSPVDCNNESPPFLNAVIGIETDIPPDKLIKIILDIEKKIGRKRSVKNAPRIIDIDILLFNNLISNDENIILPHPRMTERLFVLTPLREIAGEIIHPIIGKSINELYNEAKKTSSEKVILFALPFNLIIPPVLYR